MKKITTEPLVHFFLLGIIIFFLSGWVQQRKQRITDSIVVDNAAVGRMVMLYRMQHNAMPTKNQLDEMVEQFINDEIMYREAKKMGLDKDDEIIKRRLVQKFDFLNRDVTPLEMPVEKELISYYHKNSQLFRDSPHVSFKHIFFHNEEKGKEAAFARASELLKKIRSREISNPEKYGDRFSLQKEYNEVDLLEAKQLFGNTEFSNTLFQHPPGNWYGPVQSGYGTHLVMITKLSEAALPDFASVKEQVIERFLQDRNREQNSRVMNELKNKYYVQRDYLKDKK